MVTTGLHDSDPQRQLWCVPIETGLSAIWYETQTDAKIASVAVGRVDTKIVQQHRLLQPSEVLWLAIIRSDALRDGASCQVKLASEPETFDAHVKLAPARSRNAARVLRFITSRLRPSRNKSEWSPLSRYLAFMTSWRLRCEVVARLAGFAFAVAHVPAHRFDRTLRAFLHHKTGLSPRSIFAVPLSVESVAFVIPHPLPDRAFAEIGRELIELDLRSGALADDQRSVEWLRRLPGPVKERMFSTMQEAGTPSQQAEITRLSGAIFPTSQRIEFPGQSRLEASLATIAGGQLFIFVEATGRLDIASVQIGMADGLVTPAVWSQSRRYITPNKTDGTSPRLRFVASAAVSHNHNGIAKAVVTTNFGRHELLVGCRPCSTHALRSARSFLPDPTTDDDYVEKVARPIAALAKRQSSGTASISFGKHSIVDDSILIDIAEADDLDALHRTITAIGNTGEAPRLFVRAHLSKPERGEQVCRAMTDWADRHQLAGSVEIPLDDFDGTSCVRRRTDFNGHGLVVGLRAGTVLDAFWFRLGPKAGSASQAFLVLTPDANGAGSTIDSRRALDAKDIVGMLPRAVLGLGIPATILNSIELPEPFQSPEAEWRGIALEFLGGGRKVYARSQPASRCLDRADRPSRISERLDRLLLEQLSARLQLADARPRVALKPASRIAIRGRRPKATANANKLDAPVSARKRVAASAAAGS